MDIFEYVAINHLTICETMEPVSGGVLVYLFYLKQDPDIRGRAEDMTDALENLIKNIRAEEPVELPEMLKLLRVAKESIEEDTIRGFLKSFILPEGYPSYYNKKTGYLELYQNGKIGIVFVRPVLESLVYVAQSINRTLVDDYIRSHIDPNWGFMK